MTTFYVFISNLNTTITIMKKRSIFVLLAAVCVAAIGFTTVPESTARFEGMLEEAYAVERVMTLESETLHESIAQQMYRDFAEVERVDLHESKLGFPYYTIYGTDLEGADHLMMVKVSDKDVESTSFGYTYCQCGSCVSSYATGPCNRNTRFGIQCGCIDCSFGNCNIF